MTKQTIGKLLENLTAGMSEFRVSGRLLYRPVNKGILTGCYFEPSDFEKEVVLITYFATIVAYPLQFLAFDLPFRVLDKRGGDRWSLANEKVTSEIGDAIKLQALPFFDKIQNPTTFAEKICGVDGIQGQRAAAVAFAQAGEKTRALDIIAKLLPELDFSVSWQAEISNKLTELSKQLEVDKAASLLADWEAISRKKLKVA